LQQIGSPRRGAARCDQREDADGGVNRLLGRDKAERRRRCCITRECNMKLDAFLRLNCAQAQIGGERIEMKPPVSVDNHRHFRREHKPTRGDSAAKRRGERVTIDQCRRIVGKRA
jgi:hypothetical protein